MALLIDDKAVFLHVPKTGGTWFRHAMSQNGIKFEEIGEQHNHFPYILNLMPNGFYDDKFIFAFVRHPLTWYQSRWVFRAQHGWHLEHPLDFNCASNDFLDFLDRVFAYKPTGWLTHLYGMYINEIPNDIDFVGHTETLADDCVKVLKMIGVKFDEEKFRGTPRINQSGLDGMPSGYWAKYSSEWLDKVIVMEQTVISRYYVNYDIEAGGFLK